MSLLQQNRLNRMAYVWWLVMVGFIFAMPEMVLFTLEFWFTIGALASAFFSGFYVGGHGR